LSDHDPALATRSLALVRIAVAVLLGIHGWVRLIPLEGPLLGGVLGFGGWLSSLGFPLGVGVAAAITLGEVVGSGCLALGRFVVPACLMHGTILLAGIVMVHASNGWFVVGAGRNGVEYSVLLLCCLTAIALPRLRRR
jgi:putative oxidoreductase